MTRFATWPRWAVDALRAVLVRVPVLPGVLFDLDCECYGRDVRAWVEAEEEAKNAHVCAPPGGVH